MIRVEPFEQWVSKGRRNVEIKITNAQGKGEITIWVYDYDLGTGQFVSSVEEIDLEARKKEDDEEKESLERARYEKLRVRDFIKSLRRSVKLDREKAETLEQGSSIEQWFEGRARGVELAAEDLEELLT